MESESERGYTGLKKTRDQGGGDSKSESKKRTKNQGGFVVVSRIDIKK